MFTIQRTVTSIVVTAFAVGWISCATVATAACPVDQPTCCAIDADCDNAEPCDGVEICELATGTCRAGSPVLNGTPCPDGLFCNGADVCLGGACFHTGDPCEGDGECRDICDEATNDCNAVAGTPCSTDLNPCTADRCDGTGTCAHPPDDHATCNDGNLCTTTDHCAAGACTGTAITCATIDACHAVGQCNPASGLCSTPSQPDGTACNDGMFCNGQDACLQGVCAHAGDPCATGGSCNVCSEATASCEVPAGSACPPDDDPCTTDFCNDSGFCTHTRVVDVPCDDGDPCTDVDTCRVNGCAGTPRTCTAADACHAAGTCDQQTGVCSTSALADGTPCPDLLFCNGPDTCSAGTCLHAGDPCRVSTECNNVCDEVHDACLTPLGTPCGPGSSQPCHTTECDGAGRCVTVLENDVACDDGDRCTRNDQCTSGSCHGVPNTCAGDACHESGTCNPTTGQCVAPTKPDGTPCTSDTRLCTVDACVGGDCRHTPDDTRCDDHTCTDGACRPDAPGADTRGCVSVPAREGDICTDDGVGCTDDRCRAGTCTHLPNDANCDNTDECGSTLCAPERGDARGCAPALDRATTDTCSEDADACSDDRCDSGRCTHVQVTPYVTCQPVQAPWDLARNLARAARTLQVGVRGAGATVDPQLAAINTELESTAGALEEASGMLSGRLPPASAKNTFDTNGQRRARAALRRLGHINGLLARTMRLSATPPVRTSLGADESALLKRRGKDLRRGVRRLVAALRRAQTVSKSIAR